VPSHARPRPLLQVELPLGSAALEGRLALALRAVQALLEK
jgi:hypothetical protein